MAGCSRCFSAPCLNFCCKPSEVEVLESILLPADTSQPTEERLSAQDQSLAGFYVPFSLRFDALLDTDTLRRSLVQTLEQFPATTGRLDTSESIHCIRGNDGIMWTVHECLFNAPDSNSSISEWMRANTAHQRSGLMSPTADEPLLFIQVSLFPHQQCTILGLTFCHGLGDALSYFNFVKAWGFNFRRAQDGVDNIGNTNTAGVPTKIPVLCMENARIIPPLTTPEPCPKKEFSSNPLGVYKILFRLPHLFWSTASSSVIEFRIDMMELRKIKGNICSRLSSDAGNVSSSTRWVSSYEVIMAMLCHALSFANNRLQKSQFGIRVIVNQRPSSPHYELHHFGNATWMSEPDLIQVPLHGLDTIKDDRFVWLDDSVYNLHKQLRAFISSQNQDYSAWSRWMEKLRGLPKGSRIWMVHLDSVGRPENFVFNSWACYPWFQEIEMGKGLMPSAMCLPESFVAPDMATIWPCNRVGDLTLRMRLSSTELRHFLHVIDQWNLPLQYIHS